MKKSGRGQILLHRTRFNISNSVSAWGQQQIKSTASRLLLISCRVSTDGLFTHIWILINEAFIVLTLFSHSNINKSSCFNLNIKRINVLAALFGAAQINEESAELKAVSVQVS